MSKPFKAGITSWRICTPITPPTTPAIAFCSGSSRTKFLLSKSPTAKPPATPPTSQMMRETVSGTTDPEMLATEMPTCRWHHSIGLTSEQAHDRQRLAHEADTYAASFVNTTARFMWAIEAARQSASGDDGNVTALRLLKMAVSELETK